MFRAQLEKIPFFPATQSNVPLILLNFPPFLYFRGKISLQMSTFPGNQVPEFPIFSRHGLGRQILMGNSIKSLFRVNCWRTCLEGIFETYVHTNIFEWPPG